MDNSTILEQLFENDFVQKEIKISDKTPKIIIRTISLENQEILEEKLKTLRDAEVTQRQFYQQYGKELLSLTLVAWGAVKGKTAEEWKAFVANKSTSLLDRLIKEQQELEKAVRAAVDIDKVSETFSPQVEAPQE